MTIFPLFFFFSLAVLNIQNDMTAVFEPMRAAFLKRKTGFALHAMRCGTRLVEAF